MWTITYRYHYELNQWTIGKLTFPEVIAFLKEKQKFGAIEFIVRTE